MTELSKQEVPENGYGGLETVLLVDDNPVNLTILHKTLQNPAYRLLTANDGSTAIDIAIRERPSIILLDIIMPGMDGYKVCEKLKADPKTKDIAVIFLSALEDSSAKVKGFAVGGTDYISKPFQADEVVARVSNQIKIHRLERQLAQRNVELESENQQILNAVSEGIIGLDQQGGITLLNPSAITITGWLPEECLGKSLSELKFFDVEEEHHTPEYQTLPYRSYRMGQSAHSDMEVIRTRRNVLLPVAITSTPRKEGGAVVVIRDISEWAESEEALRVAREEVESQRQNIAHIERLSTTGEMAAGIAHEVNQPLTAVSNYSRVAKRLLEAEDVNKEKLFELLEKMIVQAERASRVIQRLRNFVKKPVAGVIAIDPNVMVSDVIALAEVDSRINDVPIHFEPKSHLPDVTIDVVQIQQVVLNLIRNAMESMSASDNRNEGVLVTSELSDQKVLFKVIDRGVGVSNEQAEKLFEPFFTTKEKGMGIGLSICQSIVQAHGGRIGFENNVNGGVCFYFSLPVK